MKAYISIIITLILVLVQPNFAKAKLKPKVKQSGTAEIGLRYDDKSIKLNNGIGSWVKSSEFERIGKIEVDLKFIPFKKNYLAFDVEYEVGLPTINVEKLYIAFLLERNQRVKMGYMKKRFGLEEIKGKNERISFDKSAIYDYVRSFNIYGEDLMIQHEWNKTLNKRVQKVKTWASIGGDASKKYFFILGSELKFKPINLLCSIMYINSESIIDDEEYYLASLGFEQKHKIITTDFEIMSGNDPNASRIEKIMGDARTVIFTGARVLQSYHIPFKINAIPQIVPYWELNFIMKDFETENRSYQFTPGVNVYLGKKKITQLMLGLDTRYCSKAPTHQDLCRYQISYLGEFKFQW